MTATHQEALTLELRLDIAQATFKVLKTPALRREVRLLTQELNGTKQPNSFAHVNSNRRSHRRRGVTLAQLIG